MHVAPNIAIDEVGRDRVYNYRSVLVGVWVCGCVLVGVWVFTSMCHSSVVFSCVVAAIFWPTAPAECTRESSILYTVAITDSNPVA